MRVEEGRAPFRSDQPAPRGDPREQRGRQRERVPVRRINYRVVSLASQPPQQPDEANRMAERIGLLERNDADPGKRFGHHRSPAREQQIDPRRGERVAQRGSQGHRQEGIADAVVGPDDEHTPQLVGPGARAAQRKRHRGEPRQQPCQQTRRRVELRLAHHASTASQCASTVSADRSRFCPCALHGEHSSSSVTTR